MDSEDDPLKDEKDRRDDANKKPHCSKIKNVKKKHHLGPSHIGIEKVKKRMSWSVVVLPET